MTTHLKMWLYLANTTLYLSNVTIYLVIFQIEYLKVILRNALPVFYEWNIPIGTQSSSETKTSCTWFLNNRKPHGLCWLSHKDQAVPIRYCTQPSFSTAERLKTTFPPDHLLMWLKSFPENIMGIANKHLINTKPQNKRAHIEIIQSSLWD